MPNWRERLAEFIRGEQRALTANDALRGLWAGMQTSSGLRVDETSSLQVIAVFNAVKILSEGFAQVPLKVYRRNGESRDELRGHPLYYLLHDAPNERMTAFNMREHWMTSLALWGNAYVEIIRNNRGDITELWPLHPGYTKPERVPGGRIIYRVRLNGDFSGYADSGRDVVLQEEDVLHIRGFSLDGFMGLSPIQQIRENIALADSYTQYAAKFFKDGSTPPFFLTTEKPLQEGVLKQMHDEWSKEHSGVGNAHKVAILHGGVKAERIGIPNDDAQFIESRGFEREEIFSFFRIPPNFWAADKVSSWGTGIEQMSIGFIKFTMDPWFVRTEQALNLKFLSENAQGPLYAEFDREGFLRGDFDSRLAGYAKLFNLGAISNVQIAQLENLPRPPMEVFLVPANMVPVEDVNAPPAPAPLPQPQPMQLPAEAASNGHGRVDLGRFVRNYLETYEHRQADKPQPMEREIVRAGNAFAYAAYRAAGTTSLVWVAGDDCDECRALDGKARTLEDRHPPLCDDCRCMIIPSDTRSDSRAISVVVNNNQPPVSVPVTVEPAQVRIEQAAQEPPIVNVAAADVTVNVPETIVPPAMVTVQVPKADPPVIEVRPTVSAPDVNVTVPAAEVTVHVPEQRAPVIEMSPVVQTQPINITVPTPEVHVTNEVRTPQVNIENKVDASPQGDIELEYDDKKGRLKGLRRKPKKD